MSKWKEFNEALKKWPLSRSTTILVEARIAAHAYDKGAAPVVGIGETMATEEVAEKLLDPTGEKYGAIHDEVELAEFGRPIDGKPIYQYALTEDAHEVIGTRQLRESPLMHLYTADDDDRDQFWACLVTGLLFDSGVSNLSQCEVIAQSSLAKARRKLINERTI